MIKIMAPCNSSHHEREVKKWLEEQIGYENYSRSGPLMREGKRWLCYFFLNEEDSTMFMLHWVGRFK